MKAVVLPPRLCMAARMVLVVRLPAGSWGSSSARERWTSPPISAAQHTLTTSVGSQRG